MNFAESVKRSSQLTRTENGALAYSTLNHGAILDLFAQVGALRTRTKEEIEEKFRQAWFSDPQLTLRLLFYAGDIRGGLGERRTFKIGLNWMARNHSEVIKNYIHLIPYYTRYDYLFALEGTPCEEEMWDFVCRQLTADMFSMTHDAIPSISLLAKWMPSENASSQETKRLAQKARTKLNLSARNYRKMLSKLRKQLCIVETSMSANEWKDITYSSVPSKAMLNYRSAFWSHDRVGFEKYLKSVEAGKEKINASVLYPYDLVEKYEDSYWYEYCEEDPVVEAQWKALPNYLTEEANILVMADVSGSMMGRPMNTSIGLAIYFAQRNRGAYHNVFLTFSKDPHFAVLQDNWSLHDCIIAATKEVGFNTDLEKAFSYVLKHARNNKIAPEDMPKAICVISDMEIDRYQYNSFDFVEAMKAEYKKYGYTLPKLIMWNVESRKDTYLSQSDDVLYISGQSPSVFKQFTETLNGKTAYMMMLDVLNDSRYSFLRV